MLLALYDSLANEYIALSTQWLADSMHAKVLCLGQRNTHVDIQHRKEVMKQML